MQIVQRGHQIDYFWEVPDLCEAFERDARTIRRWVAQGKLPEPSLRNGRKVWIGNELVNHTDELYGNPIVTVDLLGKVFTIEKNRWNEAQQRLSQERQRGWHHADIML